MVDLSAFGNYGIFGPHFVVFFGSFAPVVNSKQNVFKVIGILSTILNQNRNKILNSYLTIYELSGLLDKEVMSFYDYYKGVLLLLIVGKNQEEEGNLSQKQ